MRVLRLILRRSALTALVGVMIGLAGAWAVAESWNHSSGTRARTTRGCMWGEACCFSPWFCLPVIYRPAAPRAWIRLRC